MRSSQSGDCVLPSAGARRYKAKYKEIERGTHACKVSRLGPVKRWWNQDGKLGITIQDSPPESGRRTHLLYFTYSYCTLSRVWKLATSLLVFTILWKSISVFNIKTAGDVVTFLLIFAEYLSLHLHIFTCAYRGTHTQAHMYNQHTRGMSTTRHRSLVERGWRKTLLEALHTQKKQNEKRHVRINPIFTNLKKRFEHIELPAKLLDYFVRSNKSNINQSRKFWPVIFVS